MFQNIYGIVDNIVSPYNKDSWKLVEEEVNIFSEQYITSTLKLYFKVVIRKELVVILFSSSLLLHYFPNVCHSFKTYSGPSSVLDIMDRTNSLLMRDWEANEYRGTNIGG